VGKPEDPMKKIIARNKQAKRNFSIDNELEVGIALLGSEVKSLRAGQCSIDEAYVRFLKDELYLVNCHIPEYKFAHRGGHELRRERKLLLHRREIDKLAIKVVERGYSIIPLSIYFKGANVKLEIGLGKGKQVHDKRQDVANREAKREIARALKESRQR
jgi:SsrA-binding protein